MRPTVIAILACQAFRRKPPLLPPTAQAIFDAIEANTDGTITAGQLVAWWAAHEPSSGRAESRTNALRAVLAEARMQDQRQLDFLTFGRVLQQLIELEWQRTNDPTSGRDYFRHRQGRYPNTWSLPTANNWLAELHSQVPTGLVQTPTPSTTALNALNALNAQRSQRNGEAAHPSSPAVRMHKEENPLGLRSNEAQAHNPQPRRREERQDAHGQREALPHNRQDDGPA